MRMLVAKWREPKSLGQMAADTAQAEGSAKGIVCPACGCPVMRVQTVRRADGMNVRYRRCTNCGARRTTIET